MKLTKRVIQSTIVVGTLVVATVITAVSGPVQEQNHVVTTERNATAGITSMLADIQVSTEDEEAVKEASVEKATVATVAESQEPEMTEEEKEWSNKLVADVEAALNVRQEPNEESQVVGKLHGGDRAEVVERVNGWSYITSGNVQGYVKDDYCVFGMDAFSFAKEKCGIKATVTTEVLRVRKAASGDAEVYADVAEGKQLDVVTEAEEVEGWVAVNYNGQTAYVSSEYVEVAVGYGTGITIEEEQELIRQAQAAKAAKSAKTTQKAAVAASTDDVTLLAALIQCEAGSECYEGQVAVGAVVMNRVRSGAYPSSIYNVIYQSGQFTPAGNGKVASVISSGVSSSCISAAQQALAGTDNTGGCLYFRNVRSGISGVVIGNHVFF